MKVFYDNTVGSLENCRNQTYFFEVQIKLPSKKDLSLMTP